MKKKQYNLTGRNGGKALSIDQYTLNGEYIGTYESISAASRTVGVGVQTIATAMQSDRRTAGGFRWKVSTTQTYLLPSLGKIQRDYTDHDRKEFSRLLGRYIRVVYKLLTTLQFINDSNREDFLQEGLAYAWKSFYLYDQSQPDAKFVTFIWKYSKYGIIQVWRRTTKKWEAELCYDETAWQPVKEYPNLDNAEETTATLALYHCIEELDQSDRVLLEYFMEGEVKGAEIADKLGIPAPKYYKNLYTIKNFLRERIPFYINMIEAGKEMTSVKTDGLYTQRTGAPVEVLQYDLMGNYVATFPSIAAVKEKGFNPNDVQAVIRHRARSHKGYLWKAGKSNSQEPRIDTNIVQVDMEGRELKRWDSIKEAALAGFSSANIRDAIFNRTPYAGSLWVKVGVEIQSNRHRCHALTISNQEKDPSQADFVMKPKYWSSDIYNNTA